MLRPIVWWFLGLAIAFAATHLLAVKFSLYWYIGWFDSVMHAWGGALVVIGLFVLGSFSWFKRAPRLFEVISVLIFVTLVWELFEWYVGLWSPATYIYDTGKDIVVAFISGLLTYRLIR